MSDRYECEDCGIEHQSPKAMMLCPCAVKPVGRATPRKDPRVEQVEALRKVVTLTDEGNAETVRWNEGER